ncbi:uncharacterized protein LY89DRAFT_5576 [Mollisia scopiformis]|uniref:Uncharacterized protein n=1 Tax=Mollisia scopiformis TaxID=149040 RepID=A0A194XUK4_MOLSC|nr:uncharacterized protein LY89DRAFT_5576 [Mollisia scopiformis]KUJ23893.1 hypothetical protein LY89DRAFT_5576 [Mollisia scopiformis]
MSAAKNVALVALGALGAVVAVNQLAKPAKTAGIANAMRQQLDEYNLNVQPEQDPNDTIFDRTKILNDVKARKPWNMSYAEKERVKREE